MIEPSDNDFEEFFPKIIDIAIVKKAFDEIIYRKLLIDGYVYCKVGLVPSNKTVFKSLDKSNPSLYAIIKEKNPISYENLYNHLKQYANAEDCNFTSLDAQLILYLIFQLDGPNASTKVITMLYYYYGNEVVYHQYGEFIKRIDIEVRQIKTLHEYIKYISELADTKNLFFRGHSNINLKPQIM